MNLTTNIKKYALLLGLTAFTVLSIWLVESSKENLFESGIANSLAGNELRAQVTVFEQIIEEPEAVNSEQQAAAEVKNATASCVQSGTGCLGERLDFDKVCSTANLNFTVLPGEENVNARGVYNLKVHAVPLPETILDGVNPNQYGKPYYDNYKSETPLFRSINGVAQQGDEGIIPGGLTTCAPGDEACTDTHSVKELENRSVPISLDGQETSELFIPEEHDTKDTNESYAENPFEYPGQNHEASLECGDELENANIVPVKTNGFACLSAREILDVYTPSLADLFPILDIQCDVNDPSEQCQQVYEVNDEIVIVIGSLYDYKSSDNSLSHQEGVTKYPGSNQKINTFFQVQCFVEVQQTENSSGELEPASCLFYTPTGVDYNWELTESYPGALDDNETFLERVQEFADSRVVETCPI